MERQSEVMSEAERDAARIVVESIKGIGGVHNHLTLRQTAA
jgi:osmotically-inducible protein OsmY